MRLQRRNFLWLIGGSAVFGALGCVGNPDDDGAGDTPGAPDASQPGAPDARRDSDAGVADAAPPCDAGFVTMYDTNAQALYMDGTYGPLTGIIKVDYVIAGVELELDFWHGHGGQIHTFTLLPEHFEMLKAGVKVTLETSVVDSHNHELFIDPTDPFYRVDGAQPVQVPLGGC